MFRQILVFLSIAAAIAVNVAATSLPINDITTAEISDSFDVYFKPAGYVFAIWGLIYLGLIAFAIYQFLPQQRKVQTFKEASFWVILGSIANGSWIFLWHYQYIELSLVAMLVLLFSLIMTYTRFKIGERRESISRMLAVNIPFSIYLGWISVATIANATIVLDKIGWDGFGVEPQIWAAGMILVAGILGVSMLWTRKDLGFSLVLIWALFGIYINFPEEQTMAIAIGAAIIALLIFIGVTVLRLLAPHATTDHHKIT